MHYATSILQKQSMPSLGTREPNCWGESASIDFDVMLLTRHIHASVGATPM